MYLYQKNDNGTEITILVLPPGSLSIFQSHDDVIVNPVNCEGVSGKGLAQAFKARFPHNQRAYERICKDPRITCSAREAKLRPGTCFVFPLNNTANNRYIFNFATKDSWRNPTKIEYIENGMKDMLRKFATYTDITRITIPALGCGCGGLEWKLVCATIRNAILDWQAIRSLHFTLLPPYPHQNLK